MCAMAEGRCALSSYMTGQSPNMAGVCSPPSHVSYVEEHGSLVARLGGSTIDRLGAGEAAGYPTLCKGRYLAAGQPIYLFEEPASLNAAAILGALRAAGVSALKIEGRQRGRAYIREVVAAFRHLLDAERAGTASDPETLLRLRRLGEGQRETAGAYERGWR
jgi:putative protease